MSKTCDGSHVGCAPRADYEMEYVESGETREYCGSCVRHLCRVVTGRLWEVTEL